VINVLQRVVPNIGIPIPTLRVFQMLVSKQGIRAYKPPLRPREVSRPEVIEARLGIPFFAGDVKICCPLRHFQEHMTEPFELTSSFTGNGHAVGSRCLPSFVNLP